MKTDQDLIFEAYATTLNENDESRAKNIHEGSFWGQDKMVDQMRADEKKRGMVRLKKEPRPGQYIGKTVHKSKVQALLDDGWELADKTPTEEDKENYASEGAVNLLDQLKEEVPELEDKINQILEKVFEAVDVLQQEPYADDPELGKAYSSLIEDHVRPMGSRTF